MNDGNAGIEFDAHVFEAFERIQCEAGELHVVRWIRDQ
jgi:hypothetical protein